MGVRGMVSVSIRVRVSVALGLRLDLQYPRIAAEEAPIRTFEASASSPALHEAPQAGHPGINQRITIQQLGVVYRKHLIEL